MKSVAAIAAVLMLQGAIARAQPTQQCSFQSDYPSPVDANGKPIGALVEVDLYSQVGVVLDDVPPAQRADVAKWLLSQATDYWKARAIRQITLAYYRLNFRNYYVSNQGALPLPAPSLWTFAFGTARRAPYVSGKKQSGVDAVFIDYQMQSVILTDYNSPSASTGNRLNKPGDSVTMNFGLPLDPSLLFQRTGRACYDEYGYPRNTIDPGGEAWYFYDDTCTAKSAQPLDSTAFACNYCHCGFPRPTLDCLDALALKEGLVQPTFVFTRLPWSNTVADSYRWPRSGDMPPPVQGGSDLVGFGPDLANQREIYRYFAPNSCEKNERCIGADGGWRKLIMFNSTDINNGTRDFHVGAIPYVTSGTVPPPIIDHGDNRWGNHTAGYVGYRADVKVPRPVVDVRRVEHDELAPAAVGPDAPLVLLTGVRSKVAIDLPLFRQIRAESDEIGATLDGRRQIPRARQPIAVSHGVRPWKTRKDKGRLDEPFF